MPETISALVHTRSLYLPPIAGWLIAAHVDRCRDGFRPVGLWRYHWGGAVGLVRTFGVDAGVLRLRVVIEPQPRR